MGQYDVIVAVGVVFLGVALPETLSVIIDYLAATWRKALSFNKPTITECCHYRVLYNEIALGRISLISQEHGTYLQQQKMGSDVIMLRRL